MSIKKKIRDANIKVFQAKDFDVYEKNESIFEESRQQEIESVLSKGQGTIVDIGCGTGNILRLAKKYFQNRVGIDVSFNLLKNVKSRFGFNNLLVGEADLVPIRTESVDFVSCYALLHHLFEPFGLFREVSRILKKEGILYIDHDPNYYFARFYNFYYRLRYLNKPGFEDDTTEMSEWHNTHSSGLNPVNLRKSLIKLGFSDVKINYRITTNPSISAAFRVMRVLMKAATRVVHAKSLYTHFSIIAVK